MNIERLVERLDKGSKADDERDMVTPWRRRMVGSFGSIIYAYCCLSKLFRVGLYEWALLVGFFDPSRLLGPTSFTSCHPERSEGSASCGELQIPHFVRDDKGQGFVPDAKG